MHVGVKDRFRELLKRVRAQRFYTLLRDHLRADADGAARIAAFESDPATGGAALESYLAEHLAGDDLLARKLTAALGQGDNSTITTLVTGGHVDQIVNIARLGLLNLTVRRYLYVFKDLKQLALTLAVVCLILAASAGAVWAMRQPAVMHGDFNVAIAGLNEVSETPNSNAASLACEMLFNALNDEYRGGRFGNVEVSHARMPIISDDNDAEELARKVHAQVVIYGSVTRIGDEVRIWPRIWVTPELDSDVSAISGQHQLGMPAEFLLQELQDPDALDAEGLRSRMVVLVEFTKALSYRSSQKPYLARRAIDQALNYANQYGEFEGKETLYLIASAIAASTEDLDDAERFADEALSINKDYGRAYIAKGNVYYGRNDDATAAHYYELALDATYQPYGANVAEKAHSSLGNIAAWRFENDANDVAAAQEALDHYEAVIESYNNTHEKSLQGLAALAYYWSGVVYQYQGNWTDARRALQETLRLMQAPDMRKRAEQRLNEVKAAGG